jgi:hypothetical protein
MPHRFWRLIVVALCGACGREEVKETNLLRFIVLETGENNLVQSTVDEITQEINDALGCEAEAKTILDCISDQRMKFGLYLG